MKFAERFFARPPCSGACLVPSVLSAESRKPEYNSKLTENRNERRSRKKKKRKMYFMFYAACSRSKWKCVWNRNRTNGRTSAIDQREIKFIYTENYFGSHVMVGLARSLPRLEFILDRMKNRQKNIYKRASTTTTSMTMSSAAIAHQFFIFFWLKSGKQKFGNGYYVRSMFSRINNTNSWSFSRALTGPDNDRAFRIARCVQEHAQKNVVFPRRSHTHTHKHFCGFAMSNVLLPAAAI